MKSIIGALDRHFFAPARLSDLALLRIACVASVLIFFPPLDSELQYAHADPSLFRPIAAVKVLLLPLGAWGQVRPDALFLHAVWIGTLVACIAALIGLYTRPSLLLLAAGYTLLVGHWYSYGEVHHPEALTIITLWMLVIAPSGAALSVDALVSRVRDAAKRLRFEPRGALSAESSYARWPLRTVQWLLVLAYLSAGMSKLAVGGLAWMNGYTLVYYVAVDGLRWGSGMAPMFSGQPELLAVASIISLVFELTFVAAIIFPWLAPVYLLVGIGMHGGIYALLRAPFFQYWFLYIAFIESVRESVRGLALRRPRLPATVWTVIYDGQCPRCVSTMTILDALDWRHRLTYLDFVANADRLATLSPAVTADAARDAMHVVAPDGTVTRGFFAFRQLARVVPPLWPALPFLYLPLAGTIGSRVYELLARNRCRRDSGTLSCAV